MLANSGLVDSLAQLMEYQKGDDDMMLQLCYTFYCLVRHTDTREVILTVHRSMVETMIDLLQDKNDRIRRTASNFLDVVMDVDEEMAQEIRMRKFEIYNEEWMQAIEEDAQLEAYYDGGGEESDLEQRIAMQQQQMEQQQYEDGMMVRHPTPPHPLGRGCRRQANLPLRVLVLLRAWTQ